METLRDRRNRLAMMDLFEALELNPDDRALRRKEQSRLRQINYYNRNKDELNAKKLAQYHAKRGHIVQPVVPEILAQMPEIVPEIVPPRVLKEKPKGKPEHKKITIDTVKDKIKGVETSYALKNYQASLNRLKEEVFEDQPVFNILKHFDYVKGQLELIGNNNTRKSRLQTIMKIINNWYKLPLPEATIQKYLDLFQEYNGQSRLNTKERNQTEQILGYTEYLDKVRALPDKGNEKFKLIVEMFNETPVRDDFKKLLILYDANFLNEDHNFILLANNTARLVLNNHKTSGKYKTDIEYSKPVRDMIINYIQDKKLGILDYLFGAQPLTAYLKKQNAKVGVDGSIDLMRRMKIKDLNGLSVKERIEWANKMGHSFKVSEDHYLSTA